MLPLLHRLTATEVLGLIKDDKISVVNYARDLLGRIDQRDGVVKAWTYLGEFLSSCLRDHKLTLSSDPEFVLSQASALDQIPKNKRGPLHGLSVGIKYVMSTKGTMRISQWQQRC